MDEEFDVVVEFAPLKVLLDTLVRVDDVFDTPEPRCFLVLLLL